MRCMARCWGRVARTIDWAISKRAKAMRDNQAEVAGSHDAKKQEAARTEQAATNS
jgi:hypothetical protein